jgi:hypothetical protein
MSTQEPEQSYLTMQEREEMKRLLSFPEEFPRELGSWLVNYMAVNGQLLPHQIQGLARFTAKQDTTAASGTRASTAYGNLTPDIGVSLTGLGSGAYLVLYGVSMAGAAANKTTYMSLQVNDTPAGALYEIAYYDGPGPSWASSFVSRAAVLDLDRPSNQILTKFKTGDGTTGNFATPWIIALRLG